MRLSVKGFVENSPRKSPARHANTSGFTLIELMIVMVIVAIGLALAAPSFQIMMEKRRVTAAAEEITSFIAYVQSEAVKRNEVVNFSWYTSGGHSDQWCIGASLAPQSIPCNCRETDPTDADFCSIDSVPYRMVQTDFMDMGDDFIHMRPSASNFSFDPIRGIVVDIADAESVDGDYLFYVHSDLRAGSGKRYYELQIQVNLTGRTTICSDDDRESIIGGYPTC